MMISSNQFRFRPGDCCVNKLHGENTGNPSTKIYVNKIEYRIMFKVKTGYYLEFLTSETEMKLPGNTENQIIKNRNGENVPHIEITVVLVHWNIVIMIITKIQKFCIICSK